MRNICTLFSLVLAGKWSEGVWAHNALTNVHHTHTVSTTHYPPTLLHARTHTHTHILAYIHSHVFPLKSSLLNQGQYYTHCIPKIKLMMIKESDTKKTLPV